MASTKRIAYNGKVTLSYSYYAGTMRIDPLKIGYIMVEYDYENNVMPVIYLSLLVTDAEYNIINDNRDSGRFNLNIRKYAMNSNTTLEKVVINDSFTYIPSTSSANLMEDMNKNSTMGSQYRRILVGLISSELTNRLRKSFNGVYKNISQATLVAMALEGLDPVIEQLAYDEEYKSLIIPPLSTRYQLLNYVFEKDPYYDTNFRFFMDFDRSYLLSKKGIAVPCGDGKPDDIIIDIVSILSNEAMYEGMAVVNNSYYLYINPTDAALISDEGQEKMVNNVTIVDEDRGTNIVDLDYLKQSSISSKNITVRSENANLIKNELELGKSIVEVVKKHADGSSITPNKRFTVKNFQSNSAFNGQYLLSYKREFYKPQIVDFDLSVNLGLKKIGKLNAIKVPSAKDGKSYTAKSNKAVSATSTKTSTATKQATTKSTLISKS